MGKEITQIHEEIYQLFNKPTISKVDIVKTWRLQWLSHLECMDNTVVKWIEEAADGKEKRGRSKTKSRAVLQGVREKGSARLEEKSKEQRKIKAIGIQSINTNLWIISCKSDFQIYRSFVCASPLIDRFFCYFKYTFMLIATTYKAIIIFIDNIVHNTDWDHKQL